MNATDVKAALAARHEKDLYAEEVNCGPAGGARLDAWAMPRSWTNFETVGYEIKVSRSDWTGDRKLGIYREYVHRMWIACPWGMIQPEEVGEGFGLLWITKTGSRAICKRRAPELEAPKHFEPMISVFINRGEIVRGSRASQRFANAAYESERRRMDIRAFLNGEIADRNLGWAMAKGVAVKMAQLADKVKALESESEDLKRAKERAKASGWASIWDAVDALKSGGPNPKQLEWLANDARRLLQTIENMGGKRREDVPTKQSGAPGLEAAG
jgi:hypothetical protein